jgi:hypothetical protein
MRRFAITPFVLFAGFALAIAAAPAGQVESQNTLVGTWKLVSAKYGGQEYAFPEGTMHIKHITPTQFMWATYDESGTVTRAAGGRYTLDGDDYEETPEYGISADFSLIKGKAQLFKCKVDGNTWHHNGKLSNDLTIEEVWERMETP